MSAQPTTRPNTIYCVRCGHHTPAEKSCCERCGNQFRWDGPHIAAKPKPSVPDSPSAVNILKFDSLEESAQAVFFAAAELMRRGMTDQEVRNQLMQMGLSREAAAFVVDKLDHVRIRVDRHKAMRYALIQAIIGAAVLAVGVLITIGSYRDAANVGTGTYVIAWGTVAFGALRFVSAISILLSDDSSLY
jgi:hypothetical protein